MPLFGDKDIQRDDYKRETYNCEECDTPYEIQSDADKCCQLEEVEEETYSCETCDKEYKREKDADNCCYACDDCGEKYAKEKAAKQCCVVYKCKDCKEEYSDKREATICCETLYHVTVSLTKGDFVFKGAEDEEGYTAQERDAFINHIRETTMDGKSTILLDGILIFIKHITDVSSEDI